MFLGCGAPLERGEMSVMNIEREREKEVAFKDKDGW